MNNHTSLLVLIFVTFSLTACSNKPVLNRAKINSPMGVYESNTIPTYTIEIKQNFSYSICLLSSCFEGQYEEVSANYGAILLNFYSSSIGLEIEQLSHRTNNTDAFLKAMRQIRLNEPRPNDLAFHISDCDGTPCAGIGHRRSGVRFYKKINN